MNGNGPSGAAPDALIGIMHWRDGARGLRRRPALP
jgi:hypothetical protein